MAAQDPPQKFPEKAEQGEPDGDKCNREIPMTKGRDAMKRVRQGVAYVLIVAASSHAAEYECTVTKKVDSDYDYSAERLKKSEFSVIVEDYSDSTFVSRCSFAPSAGKVTCDRYVVDRVVTDPNIKAKKFYVFRSQFDVQLFANLRFVENNGRGGIGFGKCQLTAP